MLGTVGALWRYPVKSMLGGQVAAAAVTVRGLPGDRGLAVVDRETGRIASAKAPRLWRSLLGCSAALVDGAVRITGPDGKELWSTDPGIDQALSALLGRAVTLTGTPPPGAALDRSRPGQVLRRGSDAEVEADVVRFGSASPAGTFFDFAPLHLVSTSTLDRLAALSPRGVAEAERFRPNIVIERAGAGFVDHEWVGRDLRIGDRLTLRVIAATPRCAVPTLAHGGLPPDTAALRTLARHNRLPAMAGSDPAPSAGIYAQVLSPGMIRPGDSVRVLPPA
ncbi:MOSC domain-containing protein [Streptomyces sp. IBSBF 2435]|uniref:MOSC domain-containing protein n=1 Tax=Streptomyces sp. IBSBF 2435 TaxID=2903531 RepID=UPI002FDC2B93